MLMLDQEKAFDRVEWNWLFATLQSYNFGDAFISSRCYDDQTEAATALPFTTDTQRTHVVFRSSKW